MYTIMIHQVGEGGEVHELTIPHKDANFGSTDIPCPHCERRPLETQKVGTAVMDKGNTYVAVGCLHCGKHVGTVKHIPHTIFGVEEDLSMLEGRPRVY